MSQLLEPDEGVRISSTALQEILQNSKAFASSTPSPLSVLECSSKGQNTGRVLEASTATGETKEDEGGQKAPSCTTETALPPKIHTEVHAGSKAKKVELRVSSDNATAIATVKDHTMLFQALMIRLEKLETFQTEALHKIDSQDKEIQSLRKLVETNQKSAQQVNKENNYHQSGMLSAKNVGVSPNNLESPSRKRQQKKTSRIPFLRGSASKLCIKSPIRERVGKGDASSDSSPRKRGRECPTTEEDMPQKDWKKLKVADLRKELQLHGLSTTGKKADLVARLHAMH